MVNPNVGINLIGCAFSNNQESLVYSFIVFCRSTDGVVVCEEFEQILLNAWREEEEQAEKRKAEVWSNVLLFIYLLIYLSFPDKLMINQ